MRVCATDFRPGTRRDRPLRQAVERLADDLQRLAELDHPHAVAREAVAGGFNRHGELEVLVGGVGIGAAQVEVDARAAQQRPEMPTSSASSREMTPTPCARAMKNGLSSSMCSYSLMRLSMRSTVSRQVATQSGRHVVAHAADLVEAVEQPRADQRFEQIENQLALADAVEEDRRPAAQRAAHVEAPGAQPQQVRRDTLQLGGDDPQVLRALRHLDLADLLGRRT